MHNEFIFKLVLYYTKLFSDPGITNPEIRETILDKILLFVKDKKISLFYHERAELTAELWKGFVHFITYPQMEHLSCEMIVLFIKPMLFGNTELY